MSTSKDFFFFDINAQIIGRSCPFFRYSPIKDHINLIKTSDIGRPLYNLVEKNDVKIVDGDMPDGTEASFVHEPVTSTSKILYGHRVNAALLGHEMRHAWQVYSGIEERLKPVSVEEYVVLHRALEADARAVEFGLTIQIVSSLSIRHDYATHLVACLDDYQKRVLEFKVSKLNEFGESPVKLKQAMRQVFDGWMAFAPKVSVYEKQIAKEVERRQSVTFSNIFKTLAIRTKKTPSNLTTQGVRPGFVESLAEQLGEVSTNGNYLVESRGLDFSDVFYTRLSNFQLETLATPLRLKARNSSLKAWHI